MSALEWLELEVLDAELATVRIHLAEVNTFRRVGNVEALEQEVADLEVRRSRLLVRLTARISELPYLDEQSRAISSVDAQTYLEQTLAEPANDTGELNTDTERNQEFEIPNAMPPDKKCDDEICETSVPRREVRQSDLPSHAESIEELSPVWDELTAAHIKQATDALNERRAAILARHEDELRTLDIEHTEIEFLEHSLEMFAEKYKYLASANIPEGRPISIQ